MERKVNSVTRTYVIKYDSAVSMRRLEVLDVETREVVVSDVSLHESSIPQGHFSMVATLETWLEDGHTVSVEVGRCLKGWMLGLMTQMDSGR